MTCSNKLLGLTMESLMICITNGGRKALLQPRHCKKSIRELSTVVYWLEKYQINLSVLYIKPENSSKILSP